MRVRGVPLPGFSRTVLHVPEIRPSHQGRVKRFAWNCGEGESSGQSADADDVKRLRQAAKLVGTSTRIGVPSLRRAEAEGVRRRVRDARPQGRDAAAGQFTPTGL